MIYFISYVIVLSLVLVFFNGAAILNESIEDDSAK